MQFLCLVFVIVTLTAQSVLSKKFLDIVADCQKTVGFDGDALSLNYNDATYPDKAKCVLACALEEKGVFKVDGSIDRVKEKTIVEEMMKDDTLKKKFLAAVDECDVSAKENKCETTFEYLKCVHNKAEVHSK